MSKLTTGPEVIQMRDNLSDFLDSEIESDARLTVNYERERVFLDLAESLILAGWVTEVPTDE